MYDHKSSAPPLPQGTAVGHQPTPLILIIIILSLRAQQAAIAKQEAEEQGHRQKALQHADGVRQQVRERELQAVARRREVYKEREELDEAGRQRRLRLDEIKERKLRELK